MTDSISDRLTVGIVTCSDRAYRGERKDRGGPAVEAWLDRALESQWEAHRRLVPDESPQIEDALCELIDDEGCQLVLTTGGTGPAPRDVTPDATLAIADRELPGFGERMREISRQYVPTAILSRQVGAIRDRSLIVNLPGSPKAIGETLDELFVVVPHTLELLDGPEIETDPEVVDVFEHGHD